MPKSTVETARILAERIRRAVLDLPPMGDFNVTLSLGWYSASMANHPPT